MSRLKPGATEARPGRERRRYPRQPLDQPVKVVCAETGRYLTAVSRNISAGGALIEVAHPSLLVPGQRLGLGIMWSGRRVVIESRELIRATVVRSLGHGGGQTVAVSFGEALEMPATARAASA